MRGKGKKSTKQGPPRPPVVVLPAPDFEVGERRTPWVIRAQAEFDAVTAAYVAAVRAYQSAQALAAGSDPEFEPGGGSSGGDGGSGTW